MTCHAFRNFMKNGSLYLSNFVATINIKKMERWFEYLTMLTGGLIGWFVGEFRPSFPLIIIATLFVIYDAWSAYELDKRVHRRYPDKTKRHQAKFVSYKFKQVIPTLIERFTIIILAYSVQRWIFVDVYVPLSYIAAGVIAAEQTVSIAENKASCRDDNDKHARIWRWMARIVIDKTERHFDVNLDEAKTILDNDNN